MFLNSLRPLLLKLSILEVVTSLLFLPPSASESCFASSFQQTIADPFFFSAASLQTGPRTVPGGGHRRSYAGNSNVVLSILRQQ